MKRKTRKVEVEDPDEPKRGAKPEPCQVWMNGWRLAVVTRGRKWARITTFKRQAHRVLVASLQTKPVDEKTAKQLLDIFEPGSRTLRSNL